MMRDIVDSTLHDCDCGDEPSKVASQSMNWSESQDCGCDAGPLDFGSKFLKLSLVSAAGFVRQASALVSSSLPGLETFRLRRMCEIPETKCPPKSLGTICWKGCNERDLDAIDSRHQYLRQRTSLHIVCHTVYRAGRNHDSDQSDTERIRQVGGRRHRHGRGERDDSGQFPGGPLPNQDRGDRRVRAAYRRAALRLQSGEMHARRVSGRHPHPHSRPPLVPSFPVRRAMFPSGQETIIGCGSPPR